jgi:hypothetical protein
MSHASTKLSSSGHRFRSAVARLGASDSRRRKQWRGERGRGGEEADGATGGNLRQSRLISRLRAVRGGGQTVGES